MNKKQAFRLLSEDVSGLVLPPISEKVLLAMRDRRQESFDTADNQAPDCQCKTKSMKKFILVAALALLAVSVPAAVRLHQHAPAATEPECSAGSACASADGQTESEPADGQTESEPASTLSAANSLESVQMKQLYGEVALSDKSEEELETLLASYEKNARIYEDERYLYRFDERGRLLEMLNPSYEDKESAPADEQKMRQTATDQMKTYYPWLDLSEFTLEFSETVDGFPYWVAEYQKKVGYLVETQVRLSYDRSGELLSIVTFGMEEIAGSISKEQAVQIALEELRSGKYDLPAFRDEDVTVTAEGKHQGDQTFYAVAVSGIPMGKGFTRYAFFRISAETGEIVYSEV